MNKLKAQRVFMEKLVFSLFSLFLLVPTKVLAQGSILVSPSSPNVEQTVTMTLSPPCSFTGLVQWNFGDGSTASGGTTVTHKYMTEGTFTIIATVTCGGRPVQTSIKIAVHEAREISYSPPSPTTKDTVLFEAHHFLSSSIRWNFGDGTIKNYGSSVESHQYSQPGIYTVTALDFNGASAFPITASIKVSAAATPSISYTPSSPRTGETVTFVANNFTSSSFIRWDFGDGTIENDLTPPSITHIYTAAGIYTVRAYDNGGLFVTATTSVTVTPTVAPSITYTPLSPKAGKPVTFTALNFRSTTLIRWDFGDGTIEDDPSPPTITHIYMAGGTYVVRAYDGGGATVTATAKVSVAGEPREITCQPRDPRVNEEITFRATNFFSFQIKWDFGDGTVIATGTRDVKHTFTKPGIYTVTAWDFYGQAVPYEYPPVTAQILINPDIRMISFSPLPATVNKEITFTAINFRASLIRWDFGDGTIMNGPRVLTHVYTKEGFFQVKAYDRGGLDNYPKSEEITVLPERGPVAPFGISFIQLRFDDGKAYKEIVRNSAPLMAFADIKYEGSGILQAQWLVDGKPLGLVSRFLPFARQITVDSGKIPGLPTQVPGIHEVTLHIINPQTEFSVPVIRYFVSMEPAEKEVLSLSLSEAIDLEDRGIILFEDLLEVTAEDYFLIRGRIRNESEELLPYVLMRVYFDNELIDEKLIKNLHPQEETDFETSFYHPKGKPKEILLAFYRVSPEKTELVLLKKITVTTRPR